MNRVAVVAALIWGCCAVASAQGTRADYERAASLQSLTRNKVLREGVDPHWIEGGKALWYRVRTGSESFEWCVVDARTGEKRRAFDHDKLASALSAEGVKNAAADNLPLDQFSIDRTGDRVTFHAGGRNWEWQLKHDALKELKDLRGGSDATGSRRRGGGS
ncbi:MAG TPA: hypothetical protein VM510_07375, partial [Caulifigura sp.]|nr:hypothetical protein [Caulifigura sp.]